MAYSLKLIDDFQYEGNPLKVHVEGETDKDWIGLFLESDSDAAIATGTLPSIHWQYITAATDGVIDMADRAVVYNNIAGQLRSDYYNFISGLPAGKYKMYLFSNDSQNVVAQVHFEIRVPFSWAVDIGVSDDTVFAAFDMGGTNFIWDFVPKIKTTEKITLVGWITNPEGINTLTSKHTADRGYIPVTSDSYYYSLNSGPWTAINDVEVQERQDLVSSNVPYASDYVNGKYIYQVAGFSNLSIPADAIPNEDCVIQIALKTRKGNYIPFLVLSNVYGDAFKLSYECGNYYTGETPSPVTGVRKITEELLVQLEQEGYQDGAWYYDWYRTQPVQIGDEITQNTEIHWGWNTYSLSKILTERDIVDEISNEVPDDKIPSVKAVNEALSNINIEIEQVDYDEENFIDQTYIRNRPFYESDKLVSRKISLEMRNDNFDISSEYSYGTSVPEIEFAVKNPSGLDYQEVIYLYLDGIEYKLTLSGSFTNGKFIPSSHVVKVTHDETYYGYQYTNGAGIYVYLRKESARNIIIIGADSDKYKVAYIAVEKPQSYIKTIDERFLPMSTQPNYNNSDKSSLSYIKDRPVYEESYRKQIFHAYHSTVRYMSIGGYVKYAGIASYSEGISELPFLPCGKYELTVDSNTYEVNLDINEGVTRTTVRIQLGGGRNLHLIHDSSGWYFATDKEYEFPINKDIKFYSLTPIFAAEANLGYSSTSKDYNSISWSSEANIGFPIGCATKAIVQLTRISSFVVDGVDYASKGKCTFDIKSYDQKGLAIATTPTKGIIPTITPYGLEAAIKTTAATTYPSFVAIALVVDEPYKIKKLDEKFLPETVITEDKVAPIVEETLQTAKESGEFDGYTPVRGTDYWTPNDIAEIHKYIDDTLLGGEW